MWLPSGAGSLHYDRRILSVTKTEVQQTFLLGKTETSSNRPGTTVNGNFRFQRYITKFVPILKSAVIQKNCV